MKKLKKERIKPLCKIFKDFKIFCTETSSITNKVYGNQTAKAYGTAKTHKFKDIKNIKKEEIKFRPIND